MKKVILGLLLFLPTLLVAESNQCDIETISEEIEKCIPKKQECPECKDPVCPQPKCPEPKCPEIPPFPEFPKCDAGDAGEKCAETAKKCEETAQKCEQKNEEKEQKCEESKQVCEDAQDDIDALEMELAEAQEQLDEGNEAKDKVEELEKALEQEKKARANAEKKASELEKALEEEKKKPGDSAGNPGDSADNSGDKTPNEGPMEDPGIAIKDLLEEINKEREAAKVGELYISTRLKCAADRHSNDMGKNKNCSHTGTDKTSPWDRAEKCGTKAYGEIIACGQSTPRKAVDGWLKSAPHKKIMLNGRFKSVGLGMENNYWTAIFGY